MFDHLKQSHRLLFEVDLVPVQGQRFQPTGFADLGAASYQAPDGTWMLLVESAQSMANRMEATILDSNNELVEELQGLSYIKVQMSGAAQAKTNSLIEAHRINSPFIISNKEFQEKFAQEAGYAKGNPLDWRKIARTVFKYDVNSLLHGVFLANLGDGRIKMARAISAFIEARGVKEAVSGGVKNNPIDPSGKIRAVGYDKDVYGNVPYQRTEYTAEKITAFFNFDLALLRSYGLKDEAFELLVGLGLLKSRRLLESGLRLRTACDFMATGEIRVAQPEGWTVPEEETLLKVVQQKIIAAKELLAQPPVTEMKVSVVHKDEDKQAANED